MKLTKMIVIAALFLSGLSLAQSAELAGTWTAEFDSQVGLQKYKYEFKTVDGTLTGKATYERSTDHGTVILKNVLLKGDDVSFSEMVSFDGNDLTITYSGKIKSDEISLTRTVGDFATEEIVAKRVKDPAPEAKPAAPK